MEDMQNSNYVPGRMLISLLPSEFVFQDSQSNILPGKSNMYKALIKLQQNTEKLKQNITLLYFLNNLFIPTFLKS